MLSGACRLWLVVVLALLFGTLSAVDNPARQAFVQRWSAGTGRQAVTLNARCQRRPGLVRYRRRSPGRSMHRLVLHRQRGQLCFVIASLLSLDVASLHPVPLVRRSRGQLRAGLRYAAAVPDIARPLLMLALVGTFTFEFEVSLPLLAETSTATPPPTAGYRRAGRRGGRRRPVRGPLSPHRSRPADQGRPVLRGRGRPGRGRSRLAAAVAACVLAGVATITFLTTGNATVQLAAEPDYRGRVTALWSMALAGSAAIGAPVIGGLSDVAGPRYALALGAAACLAAAAIGRWPGGRGHAR